MPSGVTKAALCSRLMLAFILSAYALFAPFSPAQAEPLKVVAIGASNTSGWGVGAAHAYPRVLEQMLKSRGYDAQVTNAGMALDTTGGMLTRLDAAVLDGTHLVILQPGGNDRRFFISAERRAANIADMVARLRARHIESLVYDPIFPSDFYSFDRIHFTAEAHVKIAEELLPQVAAMLQRHRLRSRPTPPVSALPR